jgi:hypothetical protein
VGVRDGNTSLGLFRGIQVTDGLGDRGQPARNKALKVLWRYPRRGSCGGKRPNQMADFIRQSQDRVCKKMYSYSSGGLQTGISLLNNVHTSY